MATINGTNGNDLLQGTGVTDYIYGFNGNDIIKGGGGSDYVYGGNGNDTLDVSSANGAVYINLDYNGYGSDGFLYSYASGLTSYLYSVENAAGGKYADDIEGSSDNNNLVGNGGDDFVYGANGNDHLYGGTGHDYLYGGDDDDLLVGGVGKDDLTGGDGRDTFAFGQGDTGTGSNADTIFDFHHAEGDKINLSAIDAKATQGGNQAFTFIGQANFTANHPGTVDYHFSGNNIVVSFNTDNDTAAEGQIVLQNDHLGLVASDFIL